VDCANKKDHNLWWINMKKYVCYLKYNFKTMVRHKANFILDLFNLLLNQAISILFLYIIATNLPELGGWNITELILIYGYFLLNKGTADFLTTGLYSIEGLIQQGGLDTLIVKPMSIIQQILVSKIDLSQIVNITIGFSLIISSIASLGITSIFRVLLISIGFLLVSILVIFSLRLISMSIAFWTQTSFPVAISIDNISVFAKYPLNIYSISLEKILTIILPYAFIAYFPVALVLGKIAVTTTISYIVFVIPVIFLLSLLIWKKGLQRYESSGH